MATTRVFSCSPTERPSPALEPHSHPFGHMEATRRWCAVGVFRSRFAAELAEAGSPEQAPPGGQAVIGAIAIAGPTALAATTRVERGASSLLRTYAATERRGRWLLIQSLFSNERMTIYGAWGRKEIYCRHLL